MHRIIESLKELEPGLAQRTRDLFDAYIIDKSVEEELKGVLKEIKSNYREDTYEPFFELYLLLNNDDYKGVIQ